MQQAKGFKQPGLNNHGNTCYINSALQLIFQTDLIKQLQCPQKPVLVELVAIYNKYINGQSIDMVPFLNMLYADHDIFVKHEQGDSHEIICTLIDDILAELTTQVVGSSTVQVEDIDDDDLVNKYLKSPESSEKSTSQKLECFEQECIKLYQDQQNKQYQHCKSVMDQIKVVDKQSITCNSCGYQSLKLIYNTNITLQLNNNIQSPQLQQTLKQPLAKVYCLTATVTTKSKIPYFEIDTINDLNIENIKTKIFKSLKIIQKNKQLQEYKDNDQLDENTVNLSYYSLEFNTINIHNIICFIKQYQNGSSGDVQNASPNPENSEQQNYQLSDVQKQNIQTLIQQNVKNYNTQHVIIITAQKKQIVNYRIKKNEPVDTHSLVRLNLSIEGQQPNILSLGLMSLPYEVLKQSSGNKKFIKQYFSSCYEPFILTMQNDIDDLKTIKSQLGKVSYNICPYINDEGIYQITINVDYNKYEKQAVIQRYNILTMQKNIDTCNFSSIQDIIYMRNQQIDVLDGWKCKVCQSSGGRKNVSIMQVSKYIIININRFDFQVNKWGDVVMQKNNNELEINEILQIYTFNPTKKLFKYKLRSIICHYGNFKAGHYINISNINGQYVMFNDEKKFVVNVDQYGKEVVVLLYEKC